jgi:hypothetical protein
VCREKVEDLPNVTSYDMDKGEKKHGTVFRSWPSCMQSNALRVIHSLQPQFQTRGEIERERENSFLIVKNIATKLNNN